MKVMSAASSRSTSVMAACSAVHCPESTCFDSAGRLYGRCGSAPIIVMGAVAPRSLRASATENPLREAPTIRMPSAVDTSLLDRDGTGGAQRCGTAGGGLLRRVRVGLEQVDQAVVILVEQPAGNQGALPGTDAGRAIDDDVHLDRPTDLR